MAFRTSRKDLAARNVGFVLRAYPDHSLLKFCDEVRPCLVIGDENPMREPEQWRVTVAKKIRVPLWTVDADVIVPSKLLLKEQFGARTIRPRIHALLPKFMVRQKNLKARVRWSPPPRLRSLPATEDFIAGWKLDDSVATVPSWRGGSKQAQRLLREFVRNRLADYPEARNHPEQDGTSRLSPYLHFGHLGPHTVALAVQAQRRARRGRRKPSSNRSSCGESFLSILCASILPTTPSTVSSPGRSARWPNIRAIREPSSIARSNWSRARPTIPCGMRLRSRWF